MTCRDRAILWNCLSEFSPSLQKRLFSKKYGIDNPSMNKLRVSLECSMGFLKLAIEDLLEILFSARNLCPCNENHLGGGLIEKKQFPN